MSFCVAVQSAIFYLAACTPCNKVLHRRKVKIKARKESEEKARVVAEQPHLYHHPDPFNTNPYWSEEIRMGPSLPKKGKGGDAGKTGSQRGLTTNGSRDLASVGTASSIVVGPPTATGHHVSPKTPSPPMPAPTSTTPPGIGSAPTVVPEEDAASATLSKTASVSTGDDWNLKRYQREDEELWGHEISRTGQKLMDAIKQAGTTAGRFVESKLGIEKEVTEEDRYNFYFSPRNPPVNDYHPPVVSSKPVHRDALKWMLQPPPPAKVMEGKTPVSRTASMQSVNSRRTVGTSDGMSMGKRVGERALEARIRNGETPYEEGGLHSTSSLNKPRSRRATASTIRTRSGRRTRSYSMSTESEDSLDEVDRRRSRRPSHRRVATPEKVESEDSGDENMVRSLESLSNGPHHAAQKPRLPTILSTESASESLQQQPLQEVTNSSPASHDGISSSKGEPVGARPDLRGAEVSKGQA
ncbi:hypothetical protein B0T16DRAFT_452079 [Cercophora newfieldiana]|uniref:Signal peptide-containing protein n=1 Tax=Cercophora newfieldiana TaxID=92897 RepID=A0AA39YPW5_9PEZI|nr:hypothetical protein B0T16DRAFT_452079 [Cercophora newfieldiana]